VWDQRLARTQRLLARVLPKLHTALMVLLVAALAWDAYTVSRDPDPWGDPTTVVELLGPWLYVTLALVVAVVGFEYVEAVLTWPLDVARWLLARLRPVGGDPTRRPVAPFPPGHIRAATDRTGEAARRRSTWRTATRSVALILVPLAAVAGVVITSPGPDAPVLDLSATDAAMHDHVRTVHSLAGSPPVVRDLEIVRTPCGGLSFGKDRPVHASGYLATRPGGDPFGRMPALRTDLSARGWTVTYPVESKSGPDDRLLEAARDGYTVRIDMRYPPELTIYIQSSCHRPRT
jgi:hypothetical protein